MANEETKILLVTAQRANALQRARTAETAAFQLATYLEDVGFEGEKILDILDKAREQLRTVTSHLARIEHKKGD